MAHEMPDFESCSVCGRTILRGEQISEYVMPDFERVGVCALCKARAEAAGWTPAALAPTRDQAPPPRQTRRARLRGALSRYTERSLGRRGGESTRTEAEHFEAPAHGSRPQESRSPAEPRPQAEPKPPTPGEPQAPAQPQPPVSAEAPASANGESPPAQAAHEAAPVEPAPTEAAPAEQPKSVSSHQAQQPSSRPRSLLPSRRSDQRPVPRTVPRLMRIAVDGFNRSAEPRKVAGLIRSLGEPGVSVKAIHGVDGPVLITIGWELAWYQWEVTVREDGEEVRDVGNGKELSELPAVPRRWNAVTREDGTLRLQWHTPPPGG